MIGITEKRDSFSFANNSFNTKSPQPSYNTMYTFSYCILFYSCIDRYNTLFAALKKHALSVDELNFILLKFHLNCLTVDNALKITGFIIPEFRQKRNAFFLYPTMLPGVTIRIL